MRHSSLWLRVRAATPRWSRLLRLSAALLCAVALVASTRPARAGINVWTSHGPEGEIVTALAVDPATSTSLYAGTDGAGVFKSSDGGGTWIAVKDGLTGARVSSLVIDPVEPWKVYAGTAGGGVFAIEQVKLIHEGGCALSPAHRGRNGCWLFVPAMALWWMRRRALGTGAATSEACSGSALLR